MADIGEAFSGTRKPLRWGAVMAAATLAGLLLAVLGPFGSYLNDGLPMRALYWIACAWVGVPVYGAAFLAARKLSKPGSFTGWVSLFIAAVIASAPQTVLTRLGALWLWPELSSRFPSWPGWYVQVLSLSLVIAAAFGVVYAVRLKKSETKISAPALRPEWSAAHDVIAMKMEDHYVRVYRKSGSELILMTMAQAMGAVAGRDGLRVHRSWWVARNAVDHVEGTPRAMKLCLSNGLVAPVSRRAVTQLRAAGWLDQRGA
ncbi:MAG: LytTR family DNA-binding domain-containing protein [Parvularculaceae bacterium]